MTESPTDGIGLHKKHCWPERVKQPVWTCVIRYTQSPQGAGASFIYCWWELFAVIN